MSTPTPPAAPRPERHPRPTVALPRSPMPGIAIALVAAMLAIALFFTLNARRHHASGPAATEEASAAGGISAPPALAVPSESDEAPRPAAEPQERLLVPGAHLWSTPPAASPPATPAAIIRPAELVAPPQPPQSSPDAGGPALVYDNGPVETAKPREEGSADNVLVKPSSADDTPARTSALGDRSTVMGAGTMIPAVLETPIDSSRPGMIRAVVSEDARGFDGRLILVPRGSRLIGDYQANVHSNENRVLVTWNRLIRPDGVSIRIGSPGADGLGGAGVPGHLNTFFLQRFASSVLQSALNVGVNLASRPGNGSVVVGIPGNTGALGQALVPNDLQPKITVKQGASLNVFVARDLDFSGSPLPRQPRR